MEICFVLTECENIDIFSMWKSIVPWSIPDKTVLCSVVLKDQHEFGKVIAMMFKVSKCCRRKWIWKRTPRLPWPDWKCLTRCSVIWILAKSLLKDTGKLEVTMEINSTEASLKNLSFKKWTCNSCEYFSTTNPINTILYSYLVFLA